jgi:hypothetical protein
MKKLPPADNRTIHVPAARTFQCWSRELMTVAEVQADMGNLRLAADLCEALLGDDRIQAVLRTRVQALLGLAPTFEPTSGDGRRHGRVGKALEQGEDFWQLCPVDESALFLTWGILLGVAFGRLDWWEDRPWKPVPGVPGTSIQDKPKVRMHKGRVVPRIRFWHPRFLRFDPQANAWLARLADGTETLVTPGQNGWLLYTPYGATRPWSTAPWRGAKDWWLTKHRGMEDWERHGEKGAHLFLEAGEHANPDERTKIGQQMADAGADAVTVAPYGYTAKLLESAATGALHQNRIAAADTAFAVTFLGHANNAEVKGSNTGATAGENVRYNLASFDAETWSAFVHDQAEEPYAEVNYGDRELAQWPSYPVPKPDETAQRGAGLKALGQGVIALTVASDRVDGDKILEANNVPLLSDADLAKKRAEKAANAPPAPPAGPTPAPTTNDKADPADSDDEADDKASAPSDGRAAAET